MSTSSPITIPSNKMTPIRVPIRKAEVETITRRAPECEKCGTLKRQGKPKNTGKK
jgi:hypothetical protein